MPEHAQDPRRPETGGLRTPPVEEWDSWPFAGGVTPKTLRAPEPEPDRYGEGSAHLHWWFMARQTGLRQTASGFAMIWDDVLPPTPEDVHRANLATVVTARDAS